MTKDEIVVLLESYFSPREDVILAFLFGSVVSGTESRRSDVDVAVYLAHERNDIEDEIQCNLERIVKREVDLVVLNRAPAALAWSAIRKGIPLKIRDRKFFLDFMLDVSREGQDFIEFNLDTWRLKRSHAAG